jgi:hypothetical protein
MASTRYAPLRAALVVEVDGDVFIVYDVLDLEIETPPACLDYRLALGEPDDARFSGRAGSALFVSRRPRRRRRAATASPKKRKNR